MKIEIYKDDDGDFRWRLVAKNGKLLADSGEGYRNRKDLVKAIERIKAQISEAAVEEKSQVFSFCHSVPYPKNMS